MCLAYQSKRLGGLIHNVEAGSWQLGFSEDEKKIKKVRRKKMSNLSPPCQK